MSEIRGVTTVRTWTCPMCAHPSPGRHTHMEYRRVNERQVESTGRECDGRAVGTVESVTLAWPPSDELVERAAHALWAVHGDDEDPTPWDHASDGAKRLRRAEAAAALAAALPSKERPS